MSNASSAAASEVDPAFRMTPIHWSHRCIGEATLSGAKKQVVLSSLDAVPLQLQSFDLAEELIENAQRSNKN